jgi:hypothetical protein
MVQVISVIGLLAAILLGFPDEAHSSWEVDLQVTLPDAAADSGLASNKLILGSDTRATNRFDNTLDTVAYTGGALSARFIHPEDMLSKAQLWQDFRGDQYPQTWDMEIASPLAGTVRLSWNGKTLPSDVTLKLTDEETGTSVNMKGLNEYTFPNVAAASRRISVIAERAGDSAGNETSNPNVPPSQNPSDISSGSGGTGSGSPAGGGGCGYIKNVGSGGRSLQPGTAVVNVSLFLIPLVWLAMRRVVFSYSVVYAQS